MLLINSTCIGKGGETIKALQVCFVTLHVSVHILGVIFYCMISFFVVNKKAVTVW